MNFKWSFLGTVEYTKALALQRALREAVLADRSPGALLLLEHPPTITLGRRGAARNILSTPERLAELGIQTHRVERGGDVTYHGPGQLVGYPILRVGVAVQRFVRGLAQAAQELLSGYGIESRWRDHQPGVWTDRGKIAAVGLHVHRGVSIHGIALNLSPTLSHYQTIVPCGLTDAAMTSVEDILGVAPTVMEAAAGFAACWRPFGQPATGVEVPPEELWAVAAKGETPSE